MPTDYYAVVDISAFSLNRRRSKKKPSNRVNHLRGMHEPRPSKQNFAASS